ncbi:MAG TPA: hypothetical protein VLC95_11700, partial [Anaerolineae bacterium]|nr:hypothetical protein [Anaerolineae bacterium]
MKYPFKTLLALALVLGLLGPCFAPVHGVEPPTETRVFTAAGAQAPAVRGLPERPKRDYPLPYHRPGQPAKTSVANGARLAEAYGLTQPLTLTAALEVGVQDDPFEGNYRLVNWDQMLVVGGLPSEVEALPLQAAELVGKNPQLAPPSELPQYLTAPAWSAQGVGAVVADLNGDGCDESIAIYNDLVSHYCRLAAGNIGDLAGQLTSAPALAVFYEGSTPKLLAAVRGYDGGLWLNQYTDAPSAGNWVPLGGNLASAPAVAGGVDTAEVFYLDAGGDLYGVDVLADPPVAESLGRPPDVGLTLDPAAARWGTRTDVFARGTDNAVWHISREGSTWGAWESLRGFTTSSPAAVWQSVDRLDLVARGHDDALWHRTYSGHAWQPWHRVSGDLASAPAIMSEGPGSLDVFALDEAGRVLHLPYADNWGSWESLGGALASAPAAALFPGGIAHLLGRGLDNSVWQVVRAGGSWGSWVLRGRLPRYVITELPWSCSLDYRDQAAGHFLGDGREQVLLWDGDVLRVFQASSTGGFFLEQVDDYGPLTLHSHWMDQGETVAVGDLNGDGLEEFAALHTNGYSSGATDSVWIYQIDPGTRQITPIAHHDWSTNLYDHLYSIAAGDLNGDGMDELIAASVWNYAFPMPSVTWWAVYQVDTNAQDLVTLYNTTTTCEANARCAQAVSAGNFDNFGPDELAITWLENNQIDVRILAKNAGDWQFTLWDTEYIDTRPATSAIRHYLHTADLDRNLRDELVLEADDMDDGFVQPSLHVLYIDDAHQVQKVQSAWTTYSQYNVWASIDIGNLTGQGLRVGPPTYRRQSSVNNILAIISDVPRHKDVIDGVEYNINADDLETYARYSKELGNQNEVAVQAQRDWTFNADAELTIGEEEESNVSASLGASYGEHFEESEGTFEESLLSETITTQGDDVVVYAGTDYDVWEYPLYQNDPTAPATYVSVTFQRGGGTGLLQHSADGGECGSWFRPNHQNNNVWSYPTSTDAFLNIDPDPDHGIIMCQSTWTVGSSQHNINVNWANATETQRASQSTTELRYGLSWQHHQDSILWLTRPFQINFDITGSMGWASVKTQATRVTSTTLVEGNTMPIDDTARYNVQPCLYWAQDGYLVLDWVANPQVAAGFWSEMYGGRPDPTFIHPYDRNECAGMDDFSTDIYVNPPAATPGEVVTATAIIRNFSSVGAYEVGLRFYIGDPAKGGERIYADECLGGTHVGGDCRIHNLLGRARQEVSIVFTARGDGEQRIYAV